MGRAPCCEKEGLKKGPWAPEEDKILVDYIQANGHGSWRSLPKLAGLLRCGKSCRLRWTNYLRPDIKRGPFTPEEQKTIIQLHGIVGNKWSKIAAQLPGRTDNEVKNYWNTHLKKKLLKLEPDTCSLATIAGAAPISPATSTYGSSRSATRHMAQWESARFKAEARLAKESLLGSSSAVAVELTPPASVAGEKPEPAPEPDFFLRIWNSDVGRAFRSESEKRAGGSPIAGKVEVGSGSDVGGGEWWRDADVADDMYLDFDSGIGNVFDQFNGQFGNFTLLDGDLSLKWEFEKSTGI